MPFDIMPPALSHMLLVQNFNNLILGQINFDTLDQSFLDDKGIQLDIKTLKLMNEFYTQMMEIKESLNPEYALNLYLKYNSIIENPVHLKYFLNFLNQAYIKSVQEDAQKTFATEQEGWDLAQKVYHRTLGFYNIYSMIGDNFDKLSDIENDRGSFLKLLLDDIEWIQSNLNKKLFENSFLEHKRNIDIMLGFANEKNRHLSYKIKRLILTTPSGSERALLLSTVGYILNSYYYQALYHLTCGDLKQVMLDPPERSLEDLRTFLNQPVLQRYKLYYTDIEDQLKRDYAFLKQQYEQPSARIFLSKIAAQIDVAVEPENFQANKTKELLKICQAHVVQIKPSMVINEEAIKLLCNSVYFLAFYLVRDYDNNRQILETCQSIFEHLNFLVEMQQPDSVVKQKVRKGLHAYQVKLQNKTKKLFESMNVPSQPSPDATVLTLGELKNTVAEFSNLAGAQHNSTLQRAKMTVKNQEIEGAREALKQDNKTAQQSAQAEPEPAKSVGKKSGKKSGKKPKKPKTQADRAFEALLDSEAVKQLKDKNKILTQEKQSVEDALASLKKEHLASGSTIVAKQAELEQAQQLILKQKEEISHAKQQWEQSAREAQGFNRKIIELTKQLELADKRPKALEAEMQGLNETLAELRQQKGLADKQAKTLEAERLDLSNTIARLTAERDDAQAQLKALEEQILQLNETIAAQQDQLLTEKDQVGTQAVANSDAEKAEKVKTEAEIQSLRDTIAQYEQIIAEFRLASEADTGFQNSIIEQNQRWSTLCQGLLESNKVLYMRQVQGQAAMQGLQISGQLLYKADGPTLEFAGPLPQILQSYPDFALQLLSLSVEKQKPFSLQDHILIRDTLYQNIFQDFSFYMRFVDILTASPESFQRLYNQGFVNYLTPLTVHSAWPLSTHAVVLPWFKMVSYSLDRSNPVYNRLSLLLLAPYCVFAQTHKPELPQKHKIDSFCTTFLAKLAECNPAVSSFENVEFYRFLKQELTQGLDHWIRRFNTVNPGNTIFPEPAPVVFRTLSPVAVNSASISETVSPAAEVAASDEPVLSPDTKAGLST